MATAQFTFVDVRNAAVEILKAAATSAGNNVVSDDSLPVPTGSMPKLQVYTPREDSVAVSSAGTEPQLSTTLTLVVAGKVEGAVQATVEAQRDTLALACKQALLGGVAGQPLLSSFAEKFGRVAVEYRLEGVDAPGAAGKGGAAQFVGHFGLTIELIYSETFQPAIATDFGGMNVYVDAQQPADPSGTYTPPFGYTPTPAPRTIGPDGRVEIGATFDLPAP